MSAGGWLPDFEPDSGSFVARLWPRHPAQLGASFVELARAGVAVYLGINSLEIVANVILGRPHWPWLVLALAINEALLLAILLRSRRPIAADSLKRLLFLLFATHALTTCFQDHFTRDPFSSPAILLTIAYVASFFLPWKVCDQAIAATILGGGLLLHGLVLGQFSAGVGTAMVLMPGSIAACWFANSIRNSLFAASARAEADLERWQVLLSSSPSIIVILDREGRILDLNRAAERLTGLSRQSATALNYFERFLDSTVRQEARRRIDESAAAGQPLHLDAALSSATRGERRISWTFLPLRNGAALIATGEDISEEEQRRRELEHAYEAAEQASESKSQFLATVSHEIRSPMNIVLGMADMLGDTRLDATQASCVEAIRRSGSGLLMLLNDILDLSKIEAGRLEVNARPLDLRHLLQNLVSTFRIEAERKGLELRLECAPDLPAAVITDEMRLQQILLNLMGNALKFTEHGSVVLRSWRCDAAPGAAAPTGPAAEGEPILLCLSVRDTGPGIAPEQAAGLFQAFRQADASVAERHGGTGLGLTISRRLAELLGGRLWLNSQPGSGSTFTLEIPVSPCAPVEQPPELAPVDGQLGQRHPLRILVVDDTSLNRKLALHLLQRLGYQADAVSSGEEAILAVMAKPYDLVLMDLVMDGLGGLATTERIRAMTDLATRPRILALTASAMEADRLRCLEAGMDGFLSKPIGLQALQAALLACHAIEDASTRLASSI